MPPADRKNRITFLPGEGRIVVACDPDRGGFLKLSDGIRGGGGRFEPDQKVHVILDTPDNLRHGAQTADRATHIFVKLGAPFLSDDSAAMLRAEDHMMI